MAAATGSAKELTLDDVFPTDRVLDVQITVAEKDWDKIRHQARNFISALHEDRKTAPIDGPYEYVTADVTIDGEPSTLQLQWPKYKNLKVGEELSSSSSSSSSTGPGAGPGPRARA